VRKKYTFLSIARTAALAGTWFIIASPGAVSCQKNATYRTMEHLLVETDNNRTVDIRLAETVRITLPENATTGYRWAVERYDPELFSELPSEAHYPATRGVGSGGEVVFIFQAKKSGTDDIMLKQWRSWEGDSSAIARFHIQLRVLP
jgi:inhibitor of cysteine peptidase